MPGCSECGAPAAHLPEECPAAEWYGGGTLGACEHYYVSRDEGRGLAAELGWGTVAYYDAVIAGVELMHNAGACGVHEIER